MKPAAVLLAALIAFSPAVAAADGDRRAERKQRLIERFDADGDGRLTGAEKKRAKKAKKLRKRRLRAARRFDRIVARLDANGDGLVGPDEAGDRFERLQRFDTNGDGWVTRDELTAKRKRRR